MVHIFHFMPTSMISEIVNFFSWIFNAISSEKSCLISTWRQDTRIFPACWILIGQFKFPARQPYARMSRKAICEKALQKTLKFSNCRESIGKQIRPSCRKIFRVRFVFVWFRESSEIQRFERIFGLHSKCVVKELPPLSNFIHKAKKNLQSAEKPRF